jgi:hypothetical protein
MQIKYLLPILAVGVLLVLMLNHTMSIGNMRNAYEAEFQAQPTLGMETIQEGRLHSVCRHNYKVPLWSGKEALVCDPAVCEGADKLRPMAIILHKQRRWSPADETTYTTFYRTGHFDGWVDVSQRLGTLQTFG